MQVILLFEILDYGPNLPNKEVVAGKGFYRVAWGFLQLMPETGRPNANIPGTSVNAVDGESPVAKVHRLKLFQYQVRATLSLGDPCVRRVCAWCANGRCAKKWWWQHPLTCLLPPLFPSCLRGRVWLWLWLWPMLCPSRLCGTAVGRRRSCVSTRSTMTIAGCGGV